MNAIVQDCQNQHLSWLYYHKNVLVHVFYFRNVNIDFEIYNNSI